MREALAGCFRVLSFTTVEADGNHFQSFVLEKQRAGRGGAGSCLRAPRHDGVRPARDMGGLPSRLAAAVRDQR